MTDRLGACYQLFVSPLTIGVDLDRLAMSTVTQHSPTVAFHTQHASLLLHNSRPTVAYLPDQKFTIASMTTCHDKGIGAYILVDFGITQLERS